MKYNCKNSDGECHEYRLVSTRIERRRISSSFWHPIQDNEWASMTSDELELIALIIRRATQGVHLSDS